MLHRGQCSLNNKLQLVRKTYTTSKACAEGHCEQTRNDRLRPPADLDRSSTGIGAEEDMSKPSKPAGRRAPSVAEEKSSHSRQGPGETCPVLAALPVSKCLEECSSIQGVVQQGWLQLGSPSYYQS